MVPAMNNRVRHGSSAFRSLAAGVIGWIVAAVLFAWGNPPAEAGGMPYALFEGLPVLMKFLNETKRPRRDLKTGRVVILLGKSAAEVGRMGPEKVQIAHVGKPPFSPMITAAEAPSPFRSPQPARDRNERNGFCTCWSSSRQSADPPTPQEDRRAREAAPRAHGRRQRRGRDHRGLLDHLPCSARELHAERITEPASLARSARCASPCPSA